MLLRIPKHGWIQVGGDMSPGQYGATIARADGHAIEIRQIQPVREYVGDGEALEVGFPFWSREGYYDLDDLNPEREEVQSALDTCDLHTFLEEEDATPEQKAMAIAECLLMYGEGADEGPAGWAKDVVPGKVLWWGHKNPVGWRYLADEDRDFRELIREAKKGRRAFR